MIGAIRLLEDFLKLPVTSREDLEKLSPTESKNLHQQRKEDYEAHSKQ